MATKKRARASGKKQSRVWWNPAERAAVVAKLPSHVTLQNVTCAQLRLAQQVLPASRRRAFRASGQAAILADAFKARGVATKAATPAPARAAANGSGPTIRIAPAFAPGVGLLERLVMAAESFVASQQRLADTLAELQARAAPPPASAREAGKRLQ